MTLSRAIAAGVALASFPLLFAGGSWAQQHGHQPGMQMPHGQAEKMEPKKGPVRITMEELHKHGGVPPGWRFAIPAGDAKAGREMYARLECYKCHEIKGEQFPHAPKQPGDVGPALTGMGGQHPAEYLAESLLNPNAVIVLGEGHTGPDGLSRMPEYNDTLTVKQLIDLVAYLKSLGGEHPHGGPRPQGHGHPGPPKSH